MLNKMMKNTMKYLEEFPKELRKEYGQFFTNVSTAEYMASMIKKYDNEVKILDPGCGNGMLGAAIIQKLIDERFMGNIELTLFETDLNIINLLHKNIELLLQQCKEKHICLKIRIFQENFILFHEKEWSDNEFIGYYDIVICNPPYKKISKNSPEALCMSSIIHGQPNLYFLFMALANHLLKSNGDMIFITPRSWTSGLYFKSFRKYLLYNLNIEIMHLFTSRDKVFRTEKVLQETMILKGRKEKNQDNEIEIRVCNDAKTYDDLKSEQVSSFICLPDSEEYYVFIPTTASDINILSFVLDFKMTPQEMGFQFKTGKVVEFRNKENLRYKEGINIIPLVQACNLVDGRVEFNIDTPKAQFLYIDEKHEKLRLKNGNMVLLKRFTTKEEKRRLQPAVYLQKDNPKIHYFAAENHVNYLTKKNEEISPCEVYGFYTILSSEIWDRYYRILNGSTQVNARELNQMPIPGLDKLRSIGQKAMKYIERGKKIASDEILRGVLYEGISI